MDELTQTLKHFADKYLEQRATYIKATKDIPLKPVIEDVLPRLVWEALGHDDQYIVDGSLGKGMMTETPWICVFDRDITETAQDGYYIAILFTTDMSAIYISLAPGWTQFENAYGKKEGRLELKRTVKTAQGLLRTLPVGASLDRSNLGAKRPLGKGYENGNIASFRLSLDELKNQSQLVGFIRELMASYKELKHLVGRSIINIGAAIEEDDFQKLAQVAPEPNLPPGPVELPKKSLASGNFRWQRKPAVSKKAIQQSGYSCEIDGAHSTFISAASGKPYLEAHHLIPLEHQADFTYSLDVPENVVALCPNCHRMIHHADNETKNILLSLLFKERNVHLKLRGLALNIARLKSLY